MRLLKAPIGRLRWLAPGLLLLIAATAPGTFADARTGTQGPDLAKVNARLRKAKIPKASYGLVVRERGPRGKSIVDRGSSQSLVPASVAKVLTGAAALDAFGPGYLFRTRLAVRGTISGDALDGDLILHGSGDPTLGEGSTDTEINAIPRQFAEAVVARGIRRVSGSLVLDDAIFDRETFHPKWPASDIVQRFGAGVGGLTFHHGCLRLTVVGGKATGSRAQISSPTTIAGLKLQSEVKTNAASKTKLAAFIKNKTVYVRGTIKPRARGTIQVPVPQPQLLAGTAFFKALRKAGVHVAGSTRLVRSEADRASDEVLAEHTTPLRHVIRTMNVRSQNQYASHLHKAVGAKLYGRGTWQSGAKAVESVLLRRGIADDAAGIELLDGSGLSIHNRITAGALVQVLASFDADPLRGPWLFASLPTCGVDGTLRKRLGDPTLRKRVHAKTGTLGDVRVRSLAGYVDGRDGHPGYVFAIVLNRGVATHGVVDDLVRALFP